MSTQTIMENMNFLPSSAVRIEKEAKQKRTLVPTEAKYWRFTGKSLMVQPTGGAKLDGNGRPKKNNKGQDMSRELNFEILYVGFLDSVGESTGGFSLRAEKLFELVKTNVIPTLQGELVKYLENLKELDK